MRLFNHLQEARRNPEINKKEYIVNILSKYENQKDIYVHFSNFHKIGINPQFEFPIFGGIFAYPIKEVLDAIQIKKELFAIDRPHMFIIRPKNVFSIHDYSEDMLQKDLKYLKDYFKKTYNIENIQIDEALKWAKEQKPRYSNSVYSEKTKYFSIFYYFIWYCFIRIFKVKFSSFSWKFNKLLQLLGYRCILDEFGFIDGVEAPKQLVCLTKQDFDIITAYTVIHQKNSHEKEHKTISKKNEFLNIFDNMNAHDQEKFLIACYEFKENFEYNNIIYHLKHSNEIKIHLLENIKFGIATVMFLNWIISNYPIKVPQLKKNFIEIIEVILQKNNRLDKKSKEFVVEYISGIIDKDTAKEIKEINF